MKTPEHHNSPIRYRKWNKAHLPGKILVMRYQAMGDVVLCLPVVQHLRNSLPPETRIDLLIREETAGIPLALDLFDSIFIIRGGRSSRKQLFWYVLMWPKLVLRRYDVVLDLQNNVLSRIARRSLLPAAWSQFDKISSNHACRRYQMTVEATGFIQSQLQYNFKLRNKTRGRELLKSSGWNGTDILVALNPAGAFTSRNWAPENYVAFARLFISRIRKDVRFVVVGIDKVVEKAEYFQTQLGEHLINLVNKTTPAEAFAILQEITLMITEDSGLMHMAYISGKPVVGILGSTRSDWTDPKLPHTYCFTSDDLSCGNCMQAVCPLGTNYCLTRVTPEMVLQKTEQLLASK